MITKIVGYWRLWVGPLERAMGTACRRPGSGDCISTSLWPVWVGCLCWTVRHRQRSLRTPWSWADRPAPTRLSRRLTNSPGDSHWCSDRCVCWAETDHWGSSCGWTAAWMGTPAGSLVGRDICVRVRSVGRTVQNVMPLQEVVFGRVSLDVLDRLSHQFHVLPFEPVLGYWRHFAAAHHSDRDLCWVRSISVVFTSCKTSSKYNFTLFSDWSHT